MNQFSDILAEKLISTHGGRFEDVLVVIPTVQFKQALLNSFRKRSNDTTWLPEMMVMPELVARLTGKRSGSHLSSLVVLYEAYCKAVSNPDDFAGFCSWSSVVLKDFQDIDQYLADPMALFGNLKNISEIDHWSLGNENLTPTQEKYLGFWNDIGETHRIFSELRIERDLWSYGSLVNKLPDWKPGIAQKLKGKSIWFAGLTAFTPAEERFVFMLEEMCKVHICWDADSYYVNDPLNEAGSYLRRFAKRTMTEIPFTSSMSVGERQIEVIETATPTGEVVALAEIVSRIPPSDYPSTAIVLADNGLVQLLLHTLNDLQIPVQTAMGLPLRNLGQGQWLRLLFQMKSPARKGKIHFRMFLEWLSLSSEFDFPQSGFVQIRSEIIEKVIVYPTPGQCIDMLNRVAPDWKLSALLDPDSSPVTFLALLTNLMKEYRQENTTTALRFSVADLLVDTCVELQRLMETHAFTHSFDVIGTLWNQLSSAGEIRFDSALQDGIRVLSMVETRGLDFKNLFILGANEDRFPGNAQEQTYIPWDVRGIFHLPLPDEREAAFAYNFYRLIQRSESIHFFHSAINADYKASEPSRFIAQLSYEWPQRNSKVQWTKRTLKMSTPQNGEQVQMVPNSAYAKRRIGELLKAGLSPSAIGKFNRCPLDFYYRYIVGLGEREEVEEKISAATFGSVIHDVLEHFYRRFIGTFPDSAHFDELIADIQNQLIASFGKLYSSAAISSGINLLNLEVAAEMLTGYLQMERQRAETMAKKNQRIAVREIEFWMERDLPVEKYGLNLPVKLRGKGDRIEEIAGKQFIIDYKSGKVGSKDYTIDADMDKIVQDPDSGKLLQLLTYVYMYASKGHDPANISAGFFSFVRPKAGYSFLEHDADPENTNSWIPEFERAMTQWAQNLIELPHFEHNPDSKFCQYCQS